VDYSIFESLKLLIIETYEKIGQMPSGCFRIAFPAFSGPERRCGNRLGSTFRESSQEESRQGFQTGA
jgi:hypothetical protein